MNLKSDWDIVKERLKENDVTLTDADLVYEPGKEGELIDRLAGKMKKNRRETIAYIESISANSEKAG